MEIKRKAIWNGRINGEWLITYEVNHRIGIIIYWAPNTGPSIRLAAGGDHGSLSSLPVLNNFVKL